MRHAPAGYRLLPPLCMAQTVRPPAPAPHWIARGRANHVRGRLGQRYRLASMAARERQHREADEQIAARVSASHKRAG